jgi:DNA-binding transcriptional regulator YhcF (GntR family)
VSGQEPNRKWPGVADVLRGRIANGTLKPGSRPSIRRLGHELGVARKATARAFRALEDEGLLERVPGIGYLVTARGNPAG